MKQGKRRRKPSSKDILQKIIGSDNHDAILSDEEILDLLMPIIVELFYSVKGARDLLEQEIRNRRITRMESIKEKVLSGDIPEREVAREAAHEFDTSVRYGRYYRRVFLDGSDNLIELLADEVISLKQADKIVALGKVKEPEAIALLREGKSFRKVMAILGEMSVKDHLGQEYSSEEEMCRNWDIPIGLFSSRRKDGWPLCYALTTGINEEFSITDHHGHRFSSLARLCAYYDIDKAEFARRMDEGWTMKEALLNPYENAEKETA